MTLSKLINPAALSVLREFSRKSNTSKPSTLTIQITQNLQGVRVKTERPSADKNDRADKNREK